MALKNYKIIAFLQIIIGIFAVSTGIFLIGLRIFANNFFVKWWILVLGIIGGVLAIQLGRDRLKHPQNWNSQLW